LAYLSNERDLGISERHNVPYRTNLKTRVGRFTDALTLRPQWLFLATP